MIYYEWNAAKTQFNIWTLERIRNAFNFGNGTLKDFRRYMNDNKHIYFERID